MLYWPLLICLVATCYFVGLIWVIQLVHYPLFLRISQDSFAPYHSEHSRRMYLVLGIPVLLVFGSAILMFWLRPVAVPLWSVVLNLLFSLGVWVMTAFIHVPLHTKLGTNYALETIKSLVKMNWLRTIAWTLQAFLLLGMLIISLP